KYTDSYIFHYGRYEIDVFHKLVDKYGAPDKIKNQFTDKMIDVLPVLRSSVIFPLPFYSLKDIAKFLGFSWRHHEASGLNSVLWYHDWIKNGDERIKRNIIDYNEDDVRATWYVMQWARQRK
ncbi:TM0106 family RecB-like putative nuclease, partial [Candidatus Parcubacteria bacterium]